MKPVANDPKKDTMQENEIEETETTEPTKAQKVTATFITAVVTLVIGIAATGVSETLNKQIKKQILKTGA